jgi:hypothetical protein
MVDTDNIRKRYGFQSRIRVKDHVKTLLNTYLQYVKIFVRIAIFLVRQPRYIRHCFDLRLRFWYQIDANKTKLFDAKYAFD